MLKQKLFQLVKKTPTSNERKNKCSLDRAVFKKISAQNWI
jgi:hypothetical protein